MHLEQSIVIHRKPEEVWAILGSVSNIAKWDRGVEQTKTTAEAKDTPVGLEFDTFAETGHLEKGKMSYRIAEVGENTCRVDLTSATGNARFFKQASWTFKTRSDSQGTILVCSVDFVTRPVYFFLAPLLYAERSAIAVDLEGLKQAIEHPETRVEKQ
jgi:hypothetical protein